MGVKGLWKLLEAEGALNDCEVELASLKGKVLAVDVSIWLYQFVKSVPTNNDSTLSPMVLGGLFQRVCKLLHFGIKPIFVFDGSAPSLKKETVALRQEMRKKGEIDYGKLAKKILKSKLKLMALNDLSSSIQDNSTEVLPVLQKKNSASSIAPIDYLSIMEASDDEEEIDKFNPVSNQIDTDSLEFKRLPYDVQEQILLESRKRTMDTSQLFEVSTDSQFPESSKKVDNALDFSKAQIEALIKRRKLMDELETLRGNVTIGKNSDKRVSYGKIASSSEKKYIYAKNAQAGWSLSLTDGAETKSSENCIESFIQPQKDQSARSISDVEDDSEFMQMMFGSTDNRSTKSEQAFEQVISQNPLDSEYVQRSESESEGDLIDLDVPKSGTVHLQIYSSQTIVGVDDDHHFIRSELDNERSRLPKMVLDGLLKSPNKEHEEKDTDINIDFDFHTTNHIEIELSSSELELDDPEYEDFIDQVSKRSPVEIDGAFSESSSRFKDLVSKLQDEIREYDALKEASTLASVSPTKILIDAFMEMLYHFKLPFVVAPFEAEAQCIAISGIDGIISDDSDCLLFGAGSVYRGFFGVNRGSSIKVRRISMDQISKTIGLKRTDLIVLAHLLGCDYCTGIDGIGPKRAFELIQQVKGSDPSSALESIVALSNNPESKYYSWVKGKIAQNFTDSRITQAFLNPIVTPLKACDLNWGKFDCERLEQFMAINAKWSREKTKRFLQDLLKNNKK